MDAASIARYQHKSIRSLQTHPSIPPVTVRSSQQCFTGVHITLVGDSHTRHLFNSFIQHVLNADFKAIKDGRNKVGMNRNTSHFSSASSNRRLRMLGGLPDSDVNPWIRMRPLPDFAAFQCLSKGDAYEGKMDARHYVVEDACVFQTGWPDGDSMLLHAALLQSDLIILSWGQWQAANDRFPFMKLDHLHDWFTGQLIHWQQTNLTAILHQQQIDRWDADHQHIQNTTVLNPFRFRVNPAQPEFPALLPLGSLTLLDLAREKLLWWSPQVYASHHHPNWYRDHDGRTPERLQAYAEVQRAVLTTWGIRQFSDAIHIATPFRNCALRNDHGHIIQPIYDTQLAGVVDKAMQMRHCTG